MQALCENGLLRGAQAIADYLNSLMIGGQPVSRAAVYRMIESGKLPVTRLGSKGTELWARKRDLDKLLGMEPEQQEHAQAA
jgi:hypothetical protein